VGFRQRATHRRHRAAPANDRPLERLASIVHKLLRTADVLVGVTIRTDEAFRPLAVAEHDIAIVLAGLGGLTRAHFVNGLPVRGAELRRLHIKWTSLMTM